MIISFKEWKKTVDNWRSMQEIQSGMTVGSRNLFANYNSLRQVWSEAKQATVLNVEYGGMNDCLYKVAIHNNLFCFCHY